jgi:hypothetical protein
MKAFVLAVVVAVGGAAGAAWYLNAEMQSTVASAFTTEGARVSDPGANLVGESWTGLPGGEG